MPNNQKQQDIREMVVLILLVVAIAMLLHMLTGFSFAALIFGTGLVVLMSYLMNLDERMTRELRKEKLR